MSEKKQELLAVYTSGVWQVIDRNGKVLIDNLPDRETANTEQNALEKARAV